MRSAGVLAALLSLGVCPARAGDTAVDAPQMPSSPTPGVSGPGNLSPQLSAGPAMTGIDANVGLNAGVGATPQAAGVSAQMPQASVSGPSASVAGPSAQAAQVSPNAAATAGAPAASVPSAQGQLEAVSPSAPNAAGQAPSAPPPARARLSSTVEASARSLGSAQKLDAQAGDGAAVTGALRRIFDQDTVTARLAAGAQGSAAAQAVAGKSAQAMDRVVQTAAVAETAAPPEAPQLYQAAISAARDAQRQKLLSPAAAGGAVAAVMDFARRRAQTALPALVESAYEAAAAGEAGAREAARAVKGLDSWEGFLGAPGAPLILNKDRLEADISRVQQQASEPGARVVAPTVRVEPRGAQYFAVLPESSVVLLKDSFAADMALTSDPAAPLGSSWLDEALITHARNPGSDPALMYQLARHGARRWSAWAAASTAEWTLREALAAAWHWVKEFFLRLVGRARPAPETLLARPAPAGEAGLSAVFVDLSSVDEPYLAAQGALSSPVIGPREAAAAVGAARRLAAAYERVSGDGSGAAEVERIAARMTAEDPVSPADAQLLEFWIGRMRQGVLDRIRAPLVADASDGGMVRAVTSERSVAAALVQAGFDVSVRGPLFVATFGPGKASADLRVAVAAASAALSGKAAPAASALPADVAKAVAFARAHPRQAEAEASRIQAELAQTGATLSRLGSDSSFTVERALRRQGARVDTLYLLTEPETGRVFGFRAAPR